MFWRRGTCLLWRRGTWSLTKQLNSPFQWQIVEIEQCYSVHPPKITLHHSVRKCILILKSVLKWEKVLFSLFQHFVYFLDLYLKIDSNVQNCSVPLSKFSSQKKEKRKVLCHWYTYMLLHSWKYCFWCSFGEIKFDLTLKSSIILFVCHD